MQMLFLPPSKKLYALFHAGPIDYPTDYVDARVRLSIILSNTIRNHFRLSHMSHHSKNVEQNSQIAEHVEIQLYKVAQTLILKVKGKHQYTITHQMCSLPETI